MLIEREKYSWNYNVEEICLVHGISRQSYYQWKKREIKENYEEEIVLQLVQEKRKRQTKVGGKKLYKMLRITFKEMEFRLGRDRLFNILRDNGLLVKRKRKYIRTTNSNHRFWVYENLIKEVKVDYPNQILVGDITYLQTEEGFLYLALLTDVYSRKIVGYDVSESLSIEGSLRALKMALSGVREKKE